MRQYIEDYAEVWLPNEGTGESNEQS
jgi:hypothetical protein